jgi:hypothetical protein
MDRLLSYGGPFQGGSGAVFPRREPPVASFEPRCTSMWTRAFSGQGRALKIPAGVIILGEREDWLLI